MLWRMYSMSVCVCGRSQQNYSHLVWHETWLELIYFRIHMKNDNWQLKPRSWKFNGLKIMFVGSYFFCLKAGHECQEPLESTQWIMENGKCQYDEQKPQAFNFISCTEPSAPCSMHYGPLPIAGYLVRRWSFSVT